MTYFFMETFNRVNGITTCNPFERKFNNPFERGKKTLPLARVCGRMFLRRVFIYKSSALF